MHEYYYSLFIYLYLAESESETELDFAAAPVINGYLGDLSKLEKFIAPPCRLCTHKYACDQDLIEQRSKTYINLKN
jgi:hypothetical protein